MNQIKLNQDVKKLLVDALRSGKYKQGTGVLKRTLLAGTRLAHTQHCCLGVVCELHAEATGGKWAAPFQGEHYRGVEAYDGEDTMPPDHVSVWAGLPEGCELGQLKVYIADRYLALWKHNDEGVSFAAIADAIEEQL